jgi:hypothetical protein
MANSAGRNDGGMKWNPSIAVFEGVGARSIEDRGRREAKRRELTD